MESERGRLSKSVQSSSTLYFRGAGWEEERAQELGQGVSRLAEQAGAWAWVQVSAEKGLQQGQVSTGCSMAMWGSVCIT